MKHNPCYLLILGLGLSLFPLACGKSKKLGPDTTPPSRVGDLTATVLGSDTIRLSWTSPGDDGNSGKASSYDLRRSADPITAANFSGADTLGGVPAPAPAGDVQTCYSTDLAGSSGHHFGLRAADENGNWSPIATLGPVLTLPDTIPPGTVTNLRVLSQDDNSVTLTWTAPGDDAKRGRVDHYELRYLGGRLNQAAWQAAHSVEIGIPEPAAAGADQNADISDIALRVRVELALRAVDESGNQSPVSNIVSATLRGAARTWKISAFGPGDAPNIQAGIDSAATGDTALVGPGTYFENVLFHGKDIVLMSAQGPEVTTIDGSFASRPVITMIGGETEHATVQGFTITRGSGYQESPAGESRGGGVYGRNANPTIHNNVFRYNITTGTGAAISLMADGNPAVLIEHNAFIENESMHNGGAISCGGLVATIRFNSFFNNHCKYDGGALYLGFGYGQVLVEDNHFVENSAGDHGGAIHAIGGGGSFAFERNVFVRNRAQGSDVGDSGAGGALYSERLFASAIRHNTFVANIGRGESPHSGGAITLFLATRTSPLIESNIFAFSEGGAIGCRLGGSGSLGLNLFWGHDVDIDTAACPSDWTHRGVFANPEFCDEAGDDFRVSESSPARNGEEVMGAIGGPGCAAAQTAKIPGLWPSRQ